MHNTWLIARREYLERIRTKAFILSTVLIPVLMGGGIFFSVLSASKTKTASHIAVVSRDNQLALDLQKELESGKNSKMTVDIMNAGTRSDGDTRTFLNQELQDKSLNGYLWITPAPTPDQRPSFSYKTNAKADISTESTISAALRTVLMRERLAHQGMVSKDVDALLEPVKVDDTGSNTLNSFLGAYIMFFLMYMVVMLYGMNVARSIIEEKTSRVFEVLLATIRPSEMMAGKILGVGAVGLTQITIWLASAVSFATYGGAFTGGGHSPISFSPAQIIFFFVYFVLGFLLYSSIAAALGAMVNSEQELQQLNMFLVMPLAACMFALGIVISNPGGPVSTVISLIPFCTPLIMYLRISLQMPPVWQIALSIVLMSITIYAILWVASRIYRVGILMYGKKPNLPEIIRWLRYS